MLKMKFAVVKTCNKWWAINYFKLSWSCLVRILDRLQRLTLRWYGRIEGIDK